MRTKEGSLPGAEASLADLARHASGAKRVLVAEDDAIARRLLEARLSSAGYDVVLAEDGSKAWEILQSDRSCDLALLDWMMPGVDGIEICRRVRDLAPRGYVYILLLTARGSRADILAGLRAGADDYVTKPFDWEELESRLRTGVRILDLQSQLSEKVRELEHALGQVRTLEGLLPICMHCKRIRDDSDTWHKMEEYVESHSNAQFTHSLCKACLSEHYPEYDD